MAAQQKETRVDTVQVICGDLTTVYLESEKVLPKQPKTLKHQYPWSQNFSVSGVVITHETPMFGDYVLVTQTQIGLQACRSSMLD